jgi:hypothetical protein
MFEFDTDYKEFRYNSVRLLVRAAGWLQVHGWLEWMLQQQPQAHSTEIKKKRF